jgi:hypothetical protein
VDEIVVAIPARNESATIGACVRSIDDAARASGCRTVIAVATDSCHDGTAAQAHLVPLKWAQLVVVEGTWNGAGAARAAAVAAGIDVCRAGSRRIWIANTDADCKVPRNWLTRQLELSASHHAVAGIVELERLGTPSWLLRRFAENYVTDGPRHSHIHGANLGLRSDVYTRAGGWCVHTRVGEDQRLWDRVVRCGFRTTQTSDLRVTTSARLTSRVEGGFASDLRALLPGDLAADVA